MTGAQRQTIWCCLTSANQVCQENPFEAYLFVHEGFEMKHLFWMALAASGIAVAPAGAQDAPKKPEEKKICRLQGPALGSILSRKRACHTKAEWAQIEKDNTENTERALERVRRPGARVGEAF